MGGDLLDRVLEAMMKTRHPTAWGVCGGLAVAMFVAVFVLAPPVVDVVAGVIVIGGLVLAHRNKRTDS
jgi:hypothetical protein